MLYEIILLKQNIDIKYKRFMEGLIPNIDKKRILGIRMPKLREISKEHMGEREFIQSLFDAGLFYQEERLLYILFINLEKTFDDSIYMLTSFLPYLDNWALTDAIKPKVWNKDLDRLHVFGRRLLYDSRPFVRRLGVLIFMNYFLGEAFNFDDFNDIITIDTDNYYLRMAISWYIAEGFINHKDVILYALKKGKIKDDNIYNMAISKMLDSRRISQDLKMFLRGLKR